MKIKSRDLVPADRPRAPHAEPHPARRSGRDSDADDDDSSGNSKGSASAKPRGGGKGGDTARSGKDAKSKDAKSPGKKGGASNKSNNNKSTHTGLDGKEVADDSGDGDGDDADSARKKAQNVKHVQARQRKWRTGKPQYDYEQAMAGWKEVGPMYYYKGRYANAAPAGASAAHAAAAMLPLLLALLR